MGNIAWDIKRGILNVKVLEANLDNCQLVCQNADAEIEARLRTIQYQLNVYDSEIDDQYDPPPPGQNKNTPSPEESVEAEESDDEEEAADCREEKDPLGPWAKKAYRKIAKMTHPDKVSFLDQSLRDKFEKSYERAATAYREKDHARLIIISSDLDIEIEPPQKEHAEVLVERASSINGKIQSLLKSLGWRWSKSSEKEKEEIIRSIVKSRGWDSNRSAGRRSRPGHPGKSLSWLRREKK